VKSLDEINLWMGVVEELLRLIEEENIEELTVEEAVLGIGYTAVRITAGDVGLCHSLLGENPCPRRIARRAGTLRGMKAMEMAELAVSEDISERVVGMAALNALAHHIFQEHRYRVWRGNLLPHLLREIRPSDTVVLVGYIGPFEQPLREAASRLIILENDPTRRRGRALPGSEAPRILPEADVVVITGSSLANGSIDGVLRLSEDARIRVVVGASTPLLPDPLFDSGVDAVGAVRVLDAEKLMQIVSEGGGTREIKGAVKYLTLSPKLT